MNDAKANDHMNALDGHSLEVEITERQVRFGVRMTAIVEVNHGPSFAPFNQTKYRCTHPSRLNI